MIRFTESHEWIRLVGNVGTVGISKYAQKELGEIVSVELPKVGQQMRAKGEASVLESTKAAADVYSPVSGKVISVNSALSSDPSLINKLPESEGWLFKIELSNPKEFEQLMNEKEYRQLIG